MAELLTRRGAIPLPAFLPDATRGAIRAAPIEDVRAAGLFGVVMNAHHLSNRPGAAAIKALGGLHRFTGFDGPILTDSGGFQLYSLLRENPKRGEVRDGEVVFRREGDGKKAIYTPEKCVQAQARFGSDILMALDACTHPDDPPEAQRVSVERTVKWARRCRDEFDRIYENREGHPLLFGIVQGGGDRDLRSECGERLRAIGFDGYGFGGWPLGGDGSFRRDILRMAADAMDDRLPKYAMGLGRPEEIVELVGMGYSLFDCVIPTREARHHRLYRFREGMATPEGIRRGSVAFYEHVYILDDRHAREAGPIEEGCDCPICAGRSRAYLHHLLKLDDPQGLRYCTAHNLRFYGRLMELLRRD